MSNKAYSNVKLRTWRPAASPRSLVRRGFPDRGDPIPTCRIQELVQNFDFCLKNLGLTN